MAPVGVSLLVMLREGQLNAGREERKEEKKNGTTATDILIYYIKEWPTFIIISLQQIVTLFYFPLMCGQIPHLLLAAPKAPTKNVNETFLLLLLKFNLLQVMLTNTLQLL